MNRATILMSMTLDRRLARVMPAPGFNGINAGSTTSAGIVRAQRRLAPSPAQGIVLKIVLIAYHDCLASSVIAMFDAFNLASHLARQAGTPVQLNPVVVTPDGKSVNAFGGMPLTPTGALAGIDPDDIVVLPPMVGNIGEILAREHALIGWLRTHGGGSAVVASVCTGVFMLAEAGLLQGRKVTTNPSVAALFHRRYPDIELDTDKRIIARPASSRPAPPPPSLTWRSTWSNASPGLNWRC